MSEVHLHRIETLTPEHSADQADIARHLSEWAGDPATGRLVRTIFARAGIDRRHSVLPDFNRPAEAELFRANADGTRHRPSTRERMQVFRRHAGPMAVRLARRLLDGRDGLSAGDVTHVITVSCTGFENPGPDWAIVTELGLRPGVERYHLGFMGCYAALPALRMARQFCQADPRAVVLVICLELCSLHMQMDATPDSILGNALFSDGAAGAIVSSRRPTGNRAVLTLDGFGSAIAPEGRRDMAWEIGDLGFQLRLSSYVPDILGTHIEGIADGLLGPHGLGTGDVDLWAVHPGGRAILDRIETALGLGAEQIADSRTVLREHGNMSSATVLFVLRRMLEAGADTAAGRRIATLAFGPGLTIEGGILTLVPATRSAPHRPVAAAPLHA